MTPFEACAALAHDLEADWGKGRKAMCGRHGEATKHFALHVRAGVIEIHCFTPTAFGWHAIERAARLPNIHGVEVRRLQKWTRTTEPAC